MARRRHVSDILSEIDQRLEQQNMPLLTAEDRAQIEQKAKEHVRQKRKDKAEADYLAQAIKIEEREYEPADQLEDIVIDLAPFVASQRFNAAFISLDGTRYFHGLTYTVPFKVARTIEDVMARGWEHEREIHGERRKADEARRPILGKLSSANANVNSTAALRRSLGA